MISRISPAMTSSTSAPSSSTTRTDAADDRHGQQQFQRAFGDELHGDERPVRGGHERAAFEGRFQSGRLRHRLFDCTLCGILLLQCPSPDSTWLRDRRVSCAAPAGGRSAPRGRDRGGRSASFELWRFGATAAAAAARVEQQVRRDFERMIGVLSRVAVGDRHRSGGRAGPRGRTGCRARSVRPHRPAAAGGRQRRRTPSPSRSTTVGGVARAWVGRPSDIGADRLSGPSAFFVTPSPLGLRLVHVLPIVGPGRAAPRFGRGRARALPGAGRGDDRRRATSSCRRRSVRRRCGRDRRGPADDPRANAFLLRAPGGEPLVEVSISPDEHRSRARVRGGDRSAAVVLVDARDHDAAADRPGCSIAGPPRRRRASSCGPRPSRSRCSPAAALAFWSRARAGAGQRPPAAALLLLGGVAGAAAIGLLAGPAVRLRVASRAARQDPAGAPTSASCWSQLLAGVAVAAVLVLFERLLQRAVDPATVDLRHFSLHPWVAGRLALLTGILACHVAALWTCTLILSAALARWRLSASAAGAPGAHRPALDRAVCRRSRCWPSRREWTLPGARARPVRPRVRARRAGRAARRRLVPPHHRRGAHPGAVRGVPGSRAPALPVGRLLRGDGDAFAHRDAVRRPGAEAFSRRCRNG